MTQEEKDLLLKDLCGRLPYYTIINVNNGKYREDVKLHPHYIFDWDAERWDAKPYLRPMSSMTEEERWEFGRIFDSFSYLKLELLENGLSFHEIYDITGICDITWNELNTAIDWLNKKMFDYRGLIKMGLALEAPKGMYNEE